MSAVTISFQMFSSREEVDLETQLRLLAELGLKDVQPFFFELPGSMQEVETYASLLERYGLTAESGHFTLSQFETAPDQVEKIAKTLGMWLVVDPYISPEDRPSTAAGWDAYGARLAEVSRDMAARELTFAYHNHEFEMERLPDGSYPLDRLLGKDVALEPDLAWMIVGGADPLEFLEKYAGRIPAVHVKDMAPKGTCLDEKGFADLGYGTMDWEALWPRCLDLGARIMVLEHDQPADWRRFATRSVTAAHRIARR